MGISLYGLTPATTYDALIKTGDNEPLTASLKVLSDGVGTNLPMEASTTAINFTGTLTQAGTTLQPTLVSGTNIKTINGTSVLGSGNIAVVTSPSGVAGAIQFSNGSAFASDASNLFWDDTNNRLGIGTNAPTALLNVKGASGIVIDHTADTSLAFAQNGTTKIFMGWDSANNGMYWFTSSSIMNLSNAGNLGLGGAPIPTARLQVKGSGSTSATTSLLVQNSAGTEMFRVYDSSAIVGVGARFSDVTIGGYPFHGTNSREISVSGGSLSLQATQGTGVIIGAITLNASAILQADSTTKGFLPPRMTTTQKNAISSPATGLVVMDITTFKLCVYNGTSWVDLH